MVGGVSAKVFTAISTVDVGTILSCSDEELRPILACLVRMSLIAPLDHSPECLQGRTRVLQVLSRIELVNSIVALLSIDFHKLETDVKKEQQLRLKVGAAATDSVLVTNLSSGPSLEFERSDATRKLQLVLCELLLLMAAQPAQSQAAATKPSELFDQPVCLPEVCDVLAIALAELPALLHPTEVCEALLRLKHGPEMICHVVANQSDSWDSVVSHLLRPEAGQEEEGGSPARQRALLLLARMNPGLTLSMRARCVEWQRLPGLALQLSLLHSATNPAQCDLVPWLTGLLLGTDTQHRNWVSFWVRSGCKRRCPGLAGLRAELGRQVGELLTLCCGDTIPASLLRHSLALLRLYTALRGVAGLKFTEDEIRMLVELITKKPPASKLGARLASTGLAILIACNSLIAQPGMERVATNWIRWLVNWGQSPSEMLLLSAIHFHAGQLSAVAELVCQTLGIKMSVRTNAMTRVKQIFTQEIFTELVVAQHAVKVPVTPDLSAASGSGFLPVHCIHQLLRSRVFSKHRVSIKPWVYRQLCSTTAPLHPVLPGLVEAFVTSVLTAPSARAAADLTNEPLTETEVRAVFRPPQFCLQADQGGPVSSSGFTTQLCMLYYVLLYEDSRLGSARPGCRAPPARYTADLLADLPVKFLLGQAERQQGMFEGLYPPLLRLAATQFPHLCLVEDWIRPGPAPPPVTRGPAGHCSPGPPGPAELGAALARLTECPAAADLLLGRLMQLPARLAWQLAPTLVGNIGTLLQPGVPRHTQQLYQQVWLRLNTVFPRQLWLLTVNSLTPPPRITQEELALDPLACLRCDERVFRTGPVLQMLLYMLGACLAASRTRLSQYLADQQQGNNPALQDAEREELKNSLVLTQESAAIQILLECCQEEEDSAAGSRLRDVQETQSTVCCYLHQAFIENTTLAKLVHFQGYPHPLLAVTAAGVPSMFICLETAPELLSQPSLEKQVFAVDLISHLSVVCAMSNSLSTARLAVNAVYTLLGVLAGDQREQLLRPALPALVRISRAFPPLIEDCVQLLGQASSMLVSSAAVQGNCPGHLQETIVETFREILQQTVLSNRIF